MQKKKNSRNGYIHLYNPQKEGLGPYDFHYMNAYKKGTNFQDQQTIKAKVRYAA